MHTIDEKAVKWLTKTAYKNLWRVASWYDLDDLIQDGYMVFFKVANHYSVPHVRVQKDGTRKRVQVKDPAHLMRLFQTAFLNYINTLATNKTRDVDQVPISQLLPAHMDEHSFIERISEYAEDSGAMVELLLHAPPDVKAVLQALSAADPRTLRAPYKRRKRAGRETLNERLCRLAKLDPKTNVVHELRTYLQYA